MQTYNVIWQITIYTRHKCSQLPSQEIFFFFLTTSRCGKTGRWLLRFHHIPGSSSHKDCNCNFWKSQKPIEPRVCVGSEFLSSSSSWWYSWVYPTIPWDVGQWLSHTSPLFFPKKKKDILFFCFLFITYGSTTMLVKVCLVLIWDKLGEWVLEVLDWCSSVGFLLWV